MNDIFIFRGIDFELGFSDYTISEKSINISPLFNDKQLKPKPGDFSYRIINHWESNDLLSSSRNNGKGWRKYSVMDLVWLYIIQDMRKFGISLDQIKKVKGNLIETNKEGNQVFPLLEYYVSICLTNRPAYLLVFSNGQAHPVTEKEYQSNREFSSNNNHIQINLNNILQRIFPKTPLGVKFRDTHELNLDERKAVQLIRLGAMKKINITLTNGTTQSLTNKDKDQFENIISFLHKKNYNHFELILDDKRVLSFENDEVLIARH